MAFIIFMLELIYECMSYEQEIVVIVVVWIRMVHKDSYIWILGLQLLELFGKD